MAARKRANGAGSVFYRRATTGKKATWVAQVKIPDPLTGKTRTVTRTAGTRDEARRLLTDLLDGAPAAQPAGAITFAAWLQRWSDQNLPRLPIKDTTKTIYRDCLAWYGIPAAGTIKLVDLTPSAAELWIERVAATKKTVKAVTDADGNEARPAGRHGAPIAASSVRNTYQAASRALDTAVRDGLIPSNPLREVERPKVPRAVVPVTGADDVDRLLVACEGRHVEPLVWFVAYTGCRVGEALGLHWADVDLDAGTAVIRRAAPGAASTKNETLRTLSLVPALSDQLRSRRRQQTADRLKMGAGWQAGDLVFTSATGRPLDRRNVTHELRRALKAAGVTTERPWHSLRHGLAHRLLTAGVPLPLVSAMLGHSSVHVTVATYGHLDGTIPADVLTSALRRGK